MGPPQHDEEDVVCYTDGSRHDGSTGAAAIINYGGEQNLVTIPLGASATVFQAEVLAICWAVYAMSSLPMGRSIYIYSDSRSALQALQTWQYMTHLVGECFQALNILAGKHSVELIWIPAHEGFQGNEQADQLAKEAAGTVVYGPEPIIPVSMSSVRLAIKSVAIKKHKMLWGRYGGARQTKELIDIPSMRVSNFLITLSRSNIRLFTQVITGHSTLNGHLHRIGRADSNICPYCNNGRETSLHFLGRCDYFLTKRLDVLEGQTFGAEGVRVLEPAKLMLYIISSNRFKEDKH
ncbi:unnamed protein product [Orchesella dallaii]|uniref:RNase H type-1 domain-containing protein n=1 Tax=Orchesella dallaii TaxID=48710 RepID=A0ABP1RP28_9HEXA